MDEETEHYARVYKAKRARLNILEEQIAAMGEYNVSPHVAMERNSLTEEIGMFSIVLESPARAEAGDELGPHGRFKVYYQQNQDIKKNLAALSVESKERGNMQRKLIGLIILIGMVVLLIFAAVVALVTYLITKGAL